MFIFDYRYSLETFEACFSQCTMDWSHPVQPVVCIYFYFRIALFHLISFSCLLTLSWLHLKFYCSLEKVSLSYLLDKNSFFPEIKNVQIFLFRIKCPPSADSGQWWNSLLPFPEFVNLCSIFLMHKLWKEVLANLSEVLHFNRWLTDVMHSLLPGKGSLKPSFILLYACMRM